MKIWYQAGPGLGEVAVPALLEEETATSANVPTAAEEDPATGERELSPTSPKEEKHHFSIVLSGGNSELQFRLYL